jgi:Uma2 family endonuclease
MKAVMTDIPPFVLEWRKRTGAERWDEMWEGVLHMMPAPSLDHQFFIGRLETWLNVYWVRSRAYRVYHDVNLAPPGGWPDNYRIPDLVLLTPGCRLVNRKAYIEGAPTVVVEIQSPDDETIEKLPFYAQLGVPELWIFDRDTKEPKLLILVGGSYREQAPDGEGWFCSPGTGIRFQRESPGKLTLQYRDDPATKETLPED